MTTRKAKTATLEPTSVPVHLVRGDDASLVRDAVTELVDELVGEGDAMFLVEELAGDYEIGALVDAAHTPPFLGDRRIVVGRDVHRFSSAEQIAPLVDYLADPLPTTSLVLVWESGRVPKPLLDAVKASGGRHVDTSPGWGAREQSAWLDEHVAAAGLRFDRAAKDALAKHLGDELRRVPGILETLASTYGAGAAIGVDEIVPFLGEEGGIAPWDLTDAIDRGDISGALALLHRSLASAPHALVVMGSLVAHYGRMLRLDGADVRSDHDAAAILGIKDFPAKKVRAQAERLGHAKLARAVALLAQADLDLRGAKDWPNELVLEVLVARLAQLGQR